MDEVVPNLGDSLTVEQAMHFAIRQAQLGATAVSPNPLVGCVVLDSQGKMISFGHHEFFGGPHAEVNAIKGVSQDQLKGAHVVVTLEPCAHEGKTPSCAKMLAKLPIGKVTYGLKDPNPLVSGQGAEILKQAGIEVELMSDSFKTSGDKLVNSLEEVTEVFLWNFRQKKIFVSLKIASSMDGKIALSSGESRWITGPEAREHTHYLRSCYDATLVGIGTVLKDNPNLNIRHPKVMKENKVVIIDPRGWLLDSLEDQNLFKTHRPENIFCCHSEKQNLGNKKSSGIQLISVREKMDGELDLKDLLGKLWERGLRSVFVEGGGYTASQFLQQQVVNRIYLFQAPVILGKGLSWTEGLKFESMLEKIKIGQLHTERLGEDVFFTGIIKYASR